MTATALVIAVVVFLTVGLTILRVRINNKFGIKTSDIALALVPVAVWMVFTGKVQRTKRAELDEVLR